MAALEILRDARAPQWPPCPILDRWNMCIACGGWIDLEAGEGHDFDERPIHFNCE